MKRIPLINVRLFKKFYLLFYLLVLILISVSCNKKINKIKSINLTPDSTISSYSDSSLFFGDITGIAANDSIIVLNDSDFEKAIILNSSFDFINTIGKKGKGPGEIGNLSRRVNPIIKNHTIYLYDLIQNKITNYDIQGNKINTFNYPFKPGEDFIHFNYAMDSKGNFYSSTYLLSNPIIMFNKNGSIIKKFGKFIPGDNWEHKRSLNYRHITIAPDSNIISIYTSKPKIEIYSSKGKLLNSNNFNEYFDFFYKSKEVKIKQNPKYKYASFNLFRDICFYKNKLYVLFWGDYGQTPLSNQIAVFNYKNANFMFEKVLTLNSKNGLTSFTSICILNSKLVAFDSLTGNLLIYNKNI